MDVEENLRTATPSSLERSVPGRWNSPQWRRGAMAMKRNAQGEGYINLWAPWQKPNPGMIKKLSHF
jgi:hypothetical protein